MIGLNKSYFPLIHLPSYRTVQQANHIQSCSLNQPILFKVVVACVRRASVRARLLLCFWHIIAVGRRGGLRKFTPPLSVFEWEFSLSYITWLFRLLFSETAMLMIKELVNKYRGRVGRSTWEISSCKTNDPPLPLGSKLTEPLLIEG